MSDINISNNGNLDSKVEVKLVGWIRLLMDAFTKRANQLKKIGGPGITKTDTESFFVTLYNLGNLGRYDTVFQFETGDHTATYQVSDYLIDEGLGRHLCPPREVVMAGLAYDRKDLRVHPDMSQFHNTIMTPMEFRAFQEKLFNQFKSSGSFTDITNYVKAITLGDLSDLSNGEAFHIDGTLSSLARIPVTLTISDLLFTKDYFDYKAYPVIDQVVVNTITEIYQR